MDSLSLLAGCGRIPLLMLAYGLGFAVTAAINSYLSYRVDIRNGRKFDYKGVFGFALIWPIWLPLVLLAIRGGFLSGSER